MSKEPVDLKFSVNKNNALLVSRFKNSNSIELKILALMKTTEATKFNEFLKKQKDLEHRSQCILIPTPLNWRALDLENLIKDNNEDAFESSAMFEFLHHEDECKKLRKDIQQYKNALRKFCTKFITKLMKNDPYKILPPTFNVDHVITNVVISFMYLE